MHKIRYIRQLLYENTFPVIRNVEKESFFLEASLVNSKHRKELSALTLVENGYRAIFSVMWPDVTVCPKPKIMRWEGLPYLASYRHLATKVFQFLTRESNAQ
ncbi:hypothetical protein CDAR_369461 [Caerostris darwini]|uniref:Maturase K n=1 Tax=Caerostris darwini TaxID=1538125 RepID=A0AAV4RWY9_9ARAC|nr:hypothetical protein CDAR_369461 [Caerostris darwini]